MPCEPDQMLNVCSLGRCNYLESYDAMVRFTQSRTDQTGDELWWLQHEPVYTLGMAGKSEHVLKPGTIPVVKTDRGGQVTYHGPGQLIVYLLLDLKRIDLTIKRFVHLIEQSVIDLCNQLGVEAHRTEGAPGVYVDNMKLAALGIRVKQGCSYHGLALNVNMDLAPFSNINPCGYPGLPVTQLADLGHSMSVENAFTILLPHLLGQIGIEDYRENSISNDRRPGNTRAM